MHIVQSEISQERSKLMNFCKRSYQPTTTLAVGMKFRRINTLTKTTIDRDKISEETFQDSKQAIEKFLLNLRLTKG